jgi:hypothetical protein
MLPPWFSDILLRSCAAASALGVTVRFEGAPGATLSSLYLCEASLGQRLDSGHVEFLKSNDGAHLICEETRNSRIDTYVYEFFSTATIVEMRDALGKNVDCFAREAGSTDLWGGFVPVVDVNDSNYILSEGVVNSVRHVLFFADHELGPKYWRSETPLASSFNDFLKLCFVSIENTGYPDFWYPR